MCAFTHPAAGLNTWSEVLRTKTERVILMPAQELEMIKFMVNRRQSWVLGAWQEGGHYGKQPGGGGRGTGRIWICGWADWHLRESRNVGSYRWLSNVFLLAGVLFPCWLRKLTTLEWQLPLKSWEPDGWKILQLWPSVFDCFWTSRRHWVKSWEIRVQLPPAKSTAAWGDPSLHGVNAKAVDQTPNAHPEHPPSINVKFQKASSSIARLTFRLGGGGGEGKNPPNFHKLPEFDEGASLFQTSATDWEIWLPAFWRCLLHISSSPRPYFCAAATPPQLTLLSSLPHSTSLTHFWIIKMQ